MKRSFVYIVLPGLLFNFLTIAQYQNETYTAWTKVGSKKVEEIISNKVNKLSASLYYYEGKADIWVTESGESIYSLQSSGNLKITNLAFSHNGTD